MVGGEAAVRRRDTCNKSSSFLKVQSHLPPSQAIESVWTVLPQPAALHNVQPFPALSGNVQGMCYTRPYWE